MALMHHDFHRGIAVLMASMPGAGFYQDGHTMNRPLRVAHRGGAGLAPENTLAAFRQGLAFKADAVELDLHMSQDGALIVAHDADLKRATGTAGDIHEYTLAQLQQLNAAATYTDKTCEPQRIPTLQEVLELVRGQAGVQIEIKVRANHARYAGMEAKVVDAVRHYEMIDDVVVISFDFPTLQDISALEPRLRTCALFSTAYLSRFGIRRDDAKVAEDIASRGFRCVGAKHTLMTEGLFQVFRARDIQVGVWTVNDEADMRKFAAMGVAFITSDRPDLLHKWIADA
jgi:glycerophosphoryl diester phosphodiesterase